MRWERTLGEMITLGFIMMICCPYRGHSQDITMKEMNSSIKGFLGKNVTIPCLLDMPYDENQTLNLSNVAVQWRKIENGSDNTVYTLEANEDKQIRSESFIDIEELKRGNASLTLTHVQESDEGDYICTVIITPKKGTATIKVQLLAQSNVSLSTTKVTVEPGWKESVTCEVTNFYPELMEICWEKYNKTSGCQSTLATKTYRTLLKNNDGSFNVSSQLVVAPLSPEEDGDVYLCIMKYVFLSSNQTVNFTLNVKDLAYDSFYITVTSPAFGLVVIIITWAFWNFLRALTKVSDIVGLDDMVHMKRSLLVFMVTGFKPKNIEIHLYLQRKEDIQKYKVTSWKYPIAQETKEDFQKPDIKINFNEQDSFLDKEIQPLKPIRSFMTYSCLCATHITPDIERDDGAQLIVEVIHEGLKSPLTTYKRLKIKEAEQVGKPI